MIARSPRERRIEAAKIVATAAVNGEDVTIAKGAVILSQLFPEAVEI